MSNDPVVRDLERIIDNLRREKAADAQVIKKLQQENERLNSAIDRLFKLVEDFSLRGR